MTYDGIRLTIFAVGAFQGLFLAAALLLKETANPRATRTLAALVGVFAGLLVGALTLDLAPFPAGRWIVFVTINLELAIGPLLLFFVRYVFDPERPWKAGDAAHFLPLGAGVTGWTALYLVLRLRGDEPTLEGYRTLVAVYIAFKVCYFYAYLFFTLHTLRRELVRTRRLVAGRRRVEVGWLRGWLIGFGTVAAALYVLSFLSAIRPDVGIDSDDYASIVLALMIYLVSLMVLLRPRVLSVRPRDGGGERYEADACRLEEWLEREKPYLEPDLTLRDLADALDLAENRLSEVINDALAGGFYDLLNRYRLAHFERLARDESLRDRTVLDLAFESGFNSKASFYRVFKQAHGTTPSAYRKSLLK